MSALIRIENNPKVIILIGRVMILSIGLIIKFTALSKSEIMITLIPFSTILLPTTLVGKI
jgi:hypothetical protein